MTREDLGKKIERGLVTPLPSWWGQEQKEGASVLDNKQIALLTWIAQNIQCEPLSGIMPTGPIWNVNAVDLLDKIREIYDLNGEEMGEIINPIREEIERKQKTYRTLYRG